MERAFPVNFPVQTLCVQAATGMRAKMSLISQKGSRCHFTQGHFQVYIIHTLEMKCHEGKPVPCGPGIRRVFLTPLPFPPSSFTPEPIALWNIHVSPKSPILLWVKCDIFGKLLVIITPNLPALYTNPGDSSNHLATESGLA